MPTHQPPRHSESAKRRTQQHQRGSSIWDIVDGTGSGTGSKERPPRKAILAALCRNHDGSGQTANVPNFRTVVRATILGEQVFKITASKIYTCTSAVESEYGFGQGTEEII